MSGHPWPVFSDLGADLITPCACLAAIDRHATALSTAAAFMIAEHGPVNNEVSAVHMADATVSGQEYQMSVTWTVRPKPKGAPPSDHPAPL